MTRHRRVIERRPEQRIKERVSVGLQLIVGQDDALIEWYLSIPKGNRDPAVKKALTEWLGITPTEQDTRPTLAITGIDETSAQRIAELENIVERLETLIKEQRDGFDSRLRAIEYGSQGQIEIIESAPRISDVEKAKRKQNLKKANW